MKVDFTIKNYRCFEDTDPLRFTLDDGFTAFVGPNNAGKSSILKVFLEFRRLWSVLSDRGSFLSALRGQQIGFGELLEVYDQQEVFCNLNTRNLVIEVETSFLPHPPISKIQIVVQRGNLSVGVFIWINQEKISPDSQFQLDENNLLLPNGSPLTELSSLFEFFASLSNVIYIGPFRNALNVGGASYFDISVGTEFIDTWNRWKTGSKKVQNDTIKKVSQDIQHVFGYKDLEISASNELKTLQVFANGMSYKLRELGGGIAQFIIVLGNVAIKKPSYILIDEPELNLHPSLQLDFLTSLSSYSRNGVVFATHSLGLARSASERVYSVMRQDGKSTVCPFEQTINLSEFLGELNFGSYRALGFDGVLLVEGLKDVKTVQQFLRLLKKDHEVVLLPLGGSQFINESSEHELNELKRIAPKVFALIDSERGTEGEALSPERQDFVRICSKIGIKIHTLEKRAIENYLTDAAIQRVKGQKYSALGPYDKLEESSMPWSKSENWRITREMTLDDIKKTDLYSFLSEL